MAVELKVGKASLGVGGGNGNLKGVTESLKENNRKNDSMDVKLGIIGKILSIENFLVTTITLGSVLSCFSLTILLTLFFIKFNFSTALCI